MELNLQALLDEYARDGGDVAALLRSATSGDTDAGGPVDLAALETAAVDAFQALRTADAITDADIESMTVLADVLESIRTEQSHVAEMAAEQQARIEALAERILPPATGNGDGADGADGDAADGDGADGADGAAAANAGDAEGDAPDPTDATGAQGPGSGDGQGPGTATATGTTGHGDSAAADAVVAEAEAAAAAGADAPALVAAPTRRRVDLARVAARAGRPNPPTRVQRDVITAAADVLGVQTGAPFPDFGAVGEAAARRFRAYGRAGKSSRLRNGLAVLHKEFTPELTADGNNDQDVIDFAALESRLPGGSLLAAGGWCAPSEIMYELCDLGCSLDGMVTAPEVNAPRGGLRWTEGLDFCDIFNSPGYWTFTEAQMEAGAEKPCMEVPCPEFNECRLDVDGLCISSDLLQRVGYPETIAQFIEGAMCAHAHRLNAYKINKIYQGSTDDGLVGGNCAGAYASVMEAIELQVEAYKYRRRMARGLTLEMIAPFWLRGVIRSDLAQRNGIDRLAVTDAEINTWFALRGVRPQWVYDWQDLKNCRDADPRGSVDAYPSQVELIIYQAGTWIFATQDVITLDTLYDSTLLKRNKYMALFTEEGICVLRRCPESRRFTVPVCPNGVTGGQVVCECPPDIS